MRTGVLSDESILKHCAHYRPIPMHASERVLRGNNDHHISTPFSSKKLKYIKQVSRPQTYDALATQLSRNSGNHSGFREALHEAFDAALATPDAAAATPPTQPQPLPFHPPDIYSIIHTPQPPAAEQTPPSPGSAGSVAPPGSVDAVINWHEMQTPAQQQPTLGTPPTPVRIASFGQRHTPAPIPISSTSGLSQAVSSYTRGASAATDPFQAA